MQVAGISSAELARACGVSAQAVYEWRDTGRIHKKHLAAIATALGMSLTDLLIEPPPPALAQEPKRAALRYALHAAYPMITEDDVAGILAYADGVADTRRREKS